MNWHFLIVLPLILVVCNAYKVLVIAPIDGMSHFLYISTFARALLNRGHEVTYLTGNSLSHLKLANYTEVLIDPPFDLMSIDISQKDLLELGTRSWIYQCYFIAKIKRASNEYMYENPNVQKFIKSTELHFDVIVAEEFLFESLYMFVHKHRAPLVTIFPMGSADYIDRQQGLLNPPSFLPFHDLPYSDNMSFTERWYNTLVVVVAWIFRNLVHLPLEERYAQKYFAHLAPLPPLRDILKNTSINLINTHRAISPPRPAMPSVIPIGGAHIQAAKPLPSDLKKFLDEAENGAIYFSLGSIVQSSQLPQQLLQSFLNVFKTLKQHVLCKYEDESLDDIPSNVMVRKWMPQNDILAHPNVVLFISHGGLFGTTESLYHGVPLLLIPIFGDQFRNAHRIEAAGYGKFINHQDITEQTLSKMIREIVSDPSYLNKAKETSAIFNDNLVHPMDEAMFWIEHVARFKGAKHLKSHAVNMSWFTYLLLDVILVNLLLVVAILFVLRLLFKKLFCRNKSQTKQNLEKKRK